MIITVAGTPGAGKTTIAKMLAARLGYEHQSTGDIWARLAIERGETIDDFNARVAKDASLDQAFEETVRALGTERDNFVMDSWMGWHSIPHSYKVYLTIDPHLAAERVFANQRPDETPQSTVEAVYAMLSTRHEKLRQRYYAAYGIDITRAENYDLVIDRTSQEADAVVDTILAQLQQV